MTVAINVHIPLTLPTTRQSAANDRFGIDKSPLRNKVDEGKRLERDPIADSIDLTNRNSGLFAAATYSPPVQRQWNSSSLSGGDSGKEGLDSAQNPEEEGATDGLEEDDNETGTSGEATDARGQPLDEQEQRELSELKNRDREVRAHEQAHKATGGSYAGAISYDYQQGPDGKRYAVGGEVSIDVSKEKDPQATIAKMRQVRAAALAPAEPSAQDRSVAAEAMKKESEARQELSRETAGNANTGTAEDANGTAKDRETASQTGTASSVGSGNAPASSADASPIARLSLSRGLATASAFASPGSIDLIA